MSQLHIARQNDNLQPRTILVSFVAEETNVLLRPIYAPKASLWVCFELVEKIGGALGDR